MLAMLLVPSVCLLGLGALAAALVVMASVGDVFSVVLPAGFVVVAALFVVRAVQQVHRHHPLANWRFMCRYRADHPKSSRVTVGEAQTPTSPSALPAVVRLRQARAALPPVTSAPADSTCTGERRERSDG